MSFIYRSLHHMSMEQSKIFRIENKEFLKTELKKLHSTTSEDSSSLEDEVINIFVKALLDHGKDSNQMRQIAQISKILGQSLGLGAVYCNRLEQAARIYDIGNVLVDKEIYTKEERLSFEEFEAIKHHPLIGKEILKTEELPTTKLAAIISLEHHEWWNGGGYPLKNKGKDINIASRIVAVADAVGALFRKRPGRPAWEYARILDYIEKRSRVQFDPDVVEVFLINQEAIHEILRIDLKSAPSAWYH